MVIKMVKVDPYLHAVLLLHGAGKDISEESLTGVLKAANVEPNEAKVKLIVEAVKNVNIEELLKSASTVQVAQAAAQPQVQKEEKKEEDISKKEEQAAEGLAALFG